MQAYFIMLQQKKKFWDRQTTDTSAVMNYTENLSNNNLKYPKVQTTPNLKRVNYSKSKLYKHFKLQASKTSNIKTIILFIEKQLNDTK